MNLLKKRKTIYEIPKDICYVIGDDVDGDSRLLCLRI